MKCTFCKSNAFYRREYEGVDLCRRCFKKSIENKVRTTISKYNMFGYKDRIAVAVSGGKDSLTLLSILNKLKMKFPLSQLIAITIDEGIHNYREEAVSLAKSLAESLGIEHKLFSFKDLFQVTLDDFLKKHDELAPCSYCGVLRRRALDIAGRSIEANKIVTAHNLDDEVQTMLLNILHGGVDRLMRSSPVLADPDGRFIQRVKPLCYLYEREIALYAYVTGLNFQHIPCPHRSRALRGEIRDILNKLEDKHPSLKYTAFSSKMKLSHMIANHKVQLKSCRICGEWTSGDLCEVCRVLLENREIRCHIREA
ncbi:TIGR00269 family protein [[Eubacterium] cellulosolvens]